MSCLIEEAGDPLYIMEEFLGFDWVKNFSKFLKDMHGYLTASMLFFWIQNEKWKKKSFCEMALLLYHLKHLKILFTLLFQLEISPGNKWEEIYQKNTLIWAIKSIKIIRGWKNAAATPIFCYWYLKVGLLNLKTFKLTKYLMSLLCIPVLTKSEW